MQISQILVKSYDRVNSEVQYKTDIEWRRTAQGSITSGQIGLTVVQIARTWRRDTRG